MRGVAASASDGAGAREPLRPPLVAAVGRAAREQEERQVREQHAAEHTHGWQGGKERAAGFRARARVDRRVRTSTASCDLGWAVVSQRVRQTAHQKRREGAHSVAAGIEAERVQSVELVNTPRVSPVIAPR